MIGVRQGGGARGRPASPASDIAQVLAALRASRLYHHRDRIPAFLVIGPAGMGKSTLIQRSGLECDTTVALASSCWWLGDSAFLVEVAAAVDTEAEHPVLDRLAALRPVVPVSGIVMVVSPADLTLADAAERADMSAAQTRFLRDFETRFGYAPPLYFVVSKLDLTPGFAEFFDHLEPPEREQAWGFTLPLPADALAGKPAQPGGADTPRQRKRRAAHERDASDHARGSPSIDLAQAYQTHFRRLLDAVRARVTQWVSQETNVAQCERIVGFGAQLAALELILKPLVEPLMPSDTRRWGGARFRGLYLTSSQQDALAIDTLLPELSKRFALQRTGTAPPDLGRDDETLGYFIGALFRRVLLPEAGLVQRNNARARARRLRGRLAIGAVLAASVLLAALSVATYRSGIASIAAVNTAATAIGPSFDKTATLPAVITGLDALAALRAPAPLAPTPLVLPLDDYARALIAQAGGKLYDRAVAARLAPILNHDLARSLVQADDPSDALRLALAAADRESGSDAYERWLKGGVGAGLAPAAQTALLDHAAEARSLGQVPRVDPAYPAFARDVLSARDVGR